jgi:hypothetical protein
MIVSAMKKETNIIYTKVWKRKEKVKEEKMARRLQDLL